MGWTATTGYQQISNVVCLVGRFAIYSLCYLLPLLALFQRHCPHCIRFFDEFINCLVQCGILQILHQGVCTLSARTREVQSPALGDNTDFLHSYPSLPLEPNTKLYVLYVICELYVLCDYTLYCMYSVHCIAIGGILVS